MAKRKHNRYSQKVIQKNCKCTNFDRAGIDIPKSQKSNGNVDNDDNHTQNVYKTYLKNQDTQSSKKNVSYPILLTKSQKNKKTGNKSIISMYNKDKKHSRNEERNIHSKRLRSPKQQEPKINPLVYQFGTGDISSDTNAKYLDKTAEFKFQKHGNTNAEKDKTSLKTRLFCKCKVDKMTDKVPKNLNNKKDVVNTKQSKKSAKHKHECKCEVENNVMTLPKHTENGKKSLKQKIFCKCKENNKIITSKENPKSKIMKSKISKGANVGHGGQDLRNTTLKADTLNYTCECKFDDNNALRTVNAGDQTGEPFFEMKVNKQDMRVLNAGEIKYKVKSFGRLQSRRSCICPSHRGVCERGICEKAKKNKQTNFDCKCVTKNKSSIECSDRNCGSNVTGIFKRLIKGLFSQNKMEINSKPLFEVKLDPGNMNIVNTAEIVDIFKKSNYGVCPTGICSKHKNQNQINCKCIKNKIIPKTMECTLKTCNPGRKCNLCYLCSKVFSRCENRNGPDLYTHKSDRRPTKEINLKKQKRKDVYKRNGLNINLSKDRNRKHNRVRIRVRPLKTMRNNFSNAVRTKSRLDVSKITDKVDTTAKKQKKSKKEKERQPEGSIQDLLHSIVHKSKRSYFKKFIVQCLKRKQKRCEKKMKEHEKALKKEEQRATKENLKKLRQQEKLIKKDAANWNCITKFISGLLNLIFDSIKNMITAILSIIFSPIRSVVYIKRRLNDPNGTMAKLNNWIQRTWGNRSNKISTKIKDIGALNIIADHLEDTAVYDTLFANKGRTKEERAIYEARKRKRQQRMKQRDREARFGCRHILLTTLRKTPCLWCYFICPDLYPACLGLINFMKNFFNVLIYLLAFICWTPCIVSFEVCRAFLCCFFCTG